jgi:hypothetical protein
MVVSDAIVIVDVSVIVPLHEKVTVPPPDNAAVRWASSQVSTTTPACAAGAGKARASKTTRVTRGVWRMFRISFPISFDHRLVGRRCLVYGEQHAFAKVAEVTCLMDRSPFGVKKQITAYNNRSRQGLTRVLIIHHTPYLCHIARWIVRVSGSPGCCMEKT